MSFRSKERQSITQTEATGRSSGLLTSLDRALDQYGLSVKQVVYWKFESTFGYDRESVFSHPKEFAATLETVFGSGAKIVEKRITFEIKSARGLVKDSSCEDLADAFRFARRELAD